MHDGPDTGFHSLRTDRLILRRFSTDDIESFAAYRSDPDVARYQSWDPPFTRAQAQDFIEALADTDPDTPRHLVPVRCRRGFVGGSYR